MRRPDLRCSRLKAKNVLRRVESIVQLDFPPSNSWSGFYKCQRWSISEPESASTAMADSSDDNKGWGSWRHTLHAKHGEIDATGGQRGAHGYYAGASADV